MEEIFQRRGTVPAGYRRNNGCAQYVPDSAELLADIATLEDVVRRYDIVEVVTQDEYTHDVIVRSDKSHLVFDAT